MNYKPVPTEYRNIVFKSKSEAILARAFDEANLLEFLWTYEPTYFAYDRYTPDFLIMFNNKEDTLTTCLVEYKPSRPSGAYLDKWVKYVTYITKKTEFSDHFLPTIIYGSIYDDDPKLRSLVYLLELEGFTNPWSDKEFNFFGSGYDGLNSAKKYRFDLAAK